jgi:hypothetical protein
MRGACNPKRLFPQSTVPQFPHEGTSERDRRAKAKAWRGFAGERWLRGPKRGSCPVHSANKINGLRERLRNPFCFWNFPVGILG